MPGFSREEVFIIRQYGLYHNILNQSVSNLSLREVITVAPSTSIAQAIEKMQSKRLGCVIVVDPEDKPVGMFNESDLIRLLASGMDVVEEIVGDHLADSWACVHASDSISKVLESMQSLDLRFVCVVDTSGRARATTGQKGLMKYIAEHFPQQIQVMVHRVGIKPYDENCAGA